jgi:acetyltransferase-like isoleucine patch superfamily enzyme
VLKARAWWLLGRWRVHVHGPFTVVNPRNVSIGTNVAINHGVFLLGHSGISIGDDVVLSARCMLIDGSLALDEPGPMAGRTHCGAPITIGDGAWIGAGAIILAGVTVGRNAVVGAGSVVTRDVAQDSIVAGSPARPLRKPER